MWVFQWADLSQIKPFLGLLTLGLGSFGYVVGAASGYLIRGSNAQRAFQAWLLVWGFSGMLICLGYLLELLDLSLYGSLVGFTVKSIGSYAFVCASFYAVLLYLGTFKRTSPLFIRFVGAVVGFYILAALFDPWWHLIQVEPYLNCELSFCPLWRKSFSPLANAYFAWVALLLSYTLGQIWAYFSLVSRIYRAQMWSLYGAQAAPFIGIGLSLASFAPDAFKSQDQFSLGVCLTGICLAVGIARLGLLQNSPSLWLSTLEENEDGILGLRIDGTVVDTNRVVRRWIGQELVGQPLSSVLPQLSLLPSETVEIQGRDYAVRTQSLGHSSAPLGHMVVLHDITELEQVRRELELSQAVLEKARGLLERQNLQLEHSNALLESQRDQLDGVNSQLAGQNDQLEAAQKILGDRNTQLESARHALERQNGQLEQAQCALEEANTSLHYQAMHDALTGLYNRRHLNAVLEEWANRPIECEISLVMLDVDLFREINARHGYLGGDYVLERLGTHLKAQVPPEATACRYGGEEFCILLPEMAPEEARNWAFQLKRSISVLSLEYRGQRIRVEVSIAVTSQSSHGLDHLLSEADLALHQSKRMGRERKKSSVPTWGRSLV